MNRNKEFTAPVYLLVPLVFIQSTVLCFLLYMTSDCLKLEQAAKHEIAKNNPTLAMPHSCGKFIAQSVHAGIVILVVVGEAILFWLMRNRKYNRWLVWGYLLPLAFALGLLPVLAVQQGLFSDLLVPAPYMYWTAIILAHMFFIMIVRQARNLAPASTRNGGSDQQNKKADSPDGDWVEELHNLID